MKSLDNVKKQLERDWNGKVKTLMITHKMLANQQHYDNVLTLLGDSLKEEKNEYLKFFQNIIEPLYKALCDNNINDLCDACVTSATTGRNSTGRSRGEQKCDRLWM